MAAMPTNEPTSIMSGSMVWAVPPKLSTPSMVSRLEAMPEMRAPMALSMRQSCCMYGSQAALYMVVVPLASTAAMMMLAVPVMEASSSSMYVPLRRRACMSNTLRVSSRTNRAPSCLKPKKWVSSRRRPILSPPGSAMVALPKRPSSGPIMSTLPRKAEQRCTYSSLPR